MEAFHKIYDFTSLAAVVTGGAGVLRATMWLLSPAASFVTGTVIPMDGSLSAFSGG